MGKRAKVWGEDGKVFGECSKSIKTLVFLFYFCYSKFLPVDNLAMDSNAMLQSTVLTANALIKATTAQIHRSVHKQCGFITSVEHCSVFSIFHSWRN